MVKNELFVSRECRFFLKILERFDYFCAIFFYLMLNFVAKRIKTG